jgi:hypothetical protein
VFKAFGGLSDPESPPVSGSVCGGRARRRGPAPPLGLENL